MNITKKCAQAAYKYLSEQITNNKLKELEIQEKIDIKKQLETIIWFLLENEEISKKENNLNFFNEFLNNFQLVNFIIRNEELTLWLRLINLIMKNIKDKLPNYQILVIKILFEINKKCLTINEKDLKEKIQNEIKNENGLDKIAYLLNSVNGSLSKETLLLITELIRDSDENKKYFGKLQFKKGNCISSIIDLLWRSQNEEILEKTIICLWSLSLNNDNKIIIGELGGIEAICSLLKYFVNLIVKVDEKENENYPVETLHPKISKSKLKIEDEIKNKKIEEKIQPEEKFILRLSILENLIICLGYLTRCDQNKELIREVNGIESIHESIKNIITTDKISDENKETTLSKLIGVIWNIASNKENKIVLRNIGLLKMLIFLLDFDNDIILENVTGALWNCVVDQENKLVIYQNGGLEKLINILKNKEEQHKNEKIVNETLIENITGIIWNCASIQEIKSKIQQFNGFEILLYFFKNFKNINIQENCVGSIRNCVYIEENKSYFKKIGGLKIFITLLDETKNLSILDKILSTICKI
jgi:hypothetical protein